jgi:hypothetical protein
MCTVTCVSGREGTRRATSAGLACSFSREGSRCGELANATGERANGDEVGTVGGELGETERLGGVEALFDESESAGNSCRLGNDRESRSGYVDNQENNFAWSSSERYRSRKVRWRRRQTAWRKKLTSKDGSVSDMTCRMLLNTTASLDVGEGGIVSRVCGSTREEGEGGHARQMNVQT